LERTGLARAIKLYGINNSVKLFKLVTQKYLIQDPTMVRIVATLKDFERPNFSIAYTLGICMRIAAIKKMVTQLFTRAILIS
jgi:pyoverdine/dityrosine biosynthesis protein Dit1